MGAIGSLGEKFDNGAVSWWFLTLIAVLGVIQSYSLSQE